MKKTKILLVFAICLLLCACGNSNETEKDVAKEKTTKSTTTDEKKNVEKKDESKNTKKEKKDDDKTILESYKGKQLVLFMDKISRLGYKAKYLADGVDFTDFIDSMKDDYLVGELDIDTSKKTVTVDLELASNKELKEKEAKLKKKLELNSAWKAVEKYGNDEYGKNFELKNIAGKITEAMDDENTWFLKAECKIKKEKKICEAKVSGTTENPEVIAFEIY